MSTAFPIYLAMTAAEFAGSASLPLHPAWMACHFSCYGTGLSNRPEALPKRAMLILNDRTPIQGHDPDLVAKQLAEMAEQWELSGILIDFQRPKLEEAAQIARRVTTVLPCPTAVSEYYAKGLDCPVFLSPPPLHRPLEEHLASWAGREIWLEAALDSESITVTADGSQFAPVFPTQILEPNFQEASLCCHYHTEIAQDHVRFTLFRTTEDLTALLQQAEQLGVKQAIGLYQELGTIL